MMKKLILHNHGASTSKSNNQAIIPSTKAPKRKRDDADGFGYCYLRTRMSPNMLFTFITSNLSAKQVDDIRAIGFGGLLNLKTNIVPGALAYWLVTNFDIPSCSYMKGKLQITDEDIHLALGIPMGPNPVILATTSDKTPAFTQLKSMFLTQFNKDNATKVDVKDILELIISQREGGEEFQRNFVVFIVSLFLLGVKGTCASLRILKCLSDISAVTSFNWCQFTRKQFIECVKSWRNSSNDFFAGPIMVFVFIYLDRVSFSHFSVTRVFPTLASWSKDLIQSRYNDEMIDGFGKGGVLPPIVKGLVPEVTFSCTSQSHMPSETVDEVSEPSMSSVKQLALDSTNLALSIQNFSKSLAAATKDWPDCKIVKQLAQIASAINECSYSSQPTGEGLNHPQNKTDGSEPVKEKGSVSNEDDSAELDPLQRFRKLEFETEDELWAALAKLQIALGKQPATETSRDMKKPTHVKISDPVFVPSKAKSNSPILLDSESQEFEPLNLQKKAKSSPSVRRSPRFQHPCPSFPSPPVFTPPSFTLLSSESQSQEEEFQKVCGEKVDLQDGAGVVEPLVVHPISSLPPTEPAPIRRTMITRKRVESQLFRSPFLQRSILVAGNLRKPEKDLLEHIFSESADEREILFQSDHHRLSRGDLKTVVTGDKVPKTVIDAWCCILNKGETRRAPGSTYRVYLYDTCPYVSFTGAHLIFVPIVSETPFLICFNFIEKKLEILHAMRPNSVNYATTLQSTKQFLLNCLVENNFPSQEDVNLLVTEEYIPKSNLGDRVDSGIYLMRLLEKYKGTRKSFPLGLHNNNQVKIFGARACSQICCFDGNQLKAKVSSEAASMSLHRRFQAIDQEFGNTSHRQRELTDTELVGRVIKAKKDPDLTDILVETEWMQVCRRAMQSLQNRHWVADLVLDMYGVMCTYNRTDILYFPSTVKYAKPELHVREGKLVWCPHLKMHYVPKNGETIDTVFFTISKNNNHWLACVSDLKKEINYILDSSKPNLENQETLEEYNAYVEDIVFNVVDKLDESNGYHKLKPIILFTTVNLSVPQQANNYDCGLYVMKYLEGAIQNQNLWQDRNHFKDLLGYRRQIMLKLIKWEKNTSKVLFQQDG